MDPFINEFDLMDCDPLFLLCPTDCNDNFTHASSEIYEVTKTIDMKGINAVRQTKRYNEQKNCKTPRMSNDIVDDHDPLT